MALWLFFTSRSIKSESFHIVQKPIDSILSEGFSVPACHDLHIHAAVTKDKAQKVPEDLERRMAFLFLCPAGFQETSDAVVSEKLLQCSFDFPLSSSENSHFSYCINSAAVVYSSCGAIRSIGRRARDTDNRSRRATRESVGSITLFGVRH